MSIVAKARSSAVEREASSVKKEIERELELRLKEMLAGAAKEFSKISDISSATIEIGSAHSSAAKGIGAKVETKSIKGFVIRSADGKLALDATFDSIIEMHNGEIVGMVSAAMPKRVAKVAKLKSSGSKSARKKKR